MSQKKLYSKPPNNLTLDPIRQSKHTRQFSKLKSLDQLENQQSKEKKARSKTSTKKKNQAKKAMSIISKGKPNSPRQKNIKIRFNCKQIKQKVESYQEETMDTQKISEKKEENANKNDFNENIKKEIILQLEEQIQQRIEVQEQCQDQIVQISKEPYLQEYSNPSIQQEKEVQQNQEEPQKEIEEKQSYLQKDEEVQQNFLIQENPYTTQQYVKRSMAQILQLELEYNKQEEQEYEIQQQG